MKLGEGLPASGSRGGGGRGEIAATGHEHAVFIACDRPLADDEWGVQGRGGEGGMVRIFCAGTVAEVDFHGTIWIGLGGEGNEGFFTIGPRIDWHAIHVGSQRAVSAGRTVGVRHDLLILRRSVHQ